MRSEEDLLITTVLQIRFKFAQKNSFSASEKKCIDLVQNFTTAIACTALEASLVLNEEMRVK